nr:ABC transporter ATP-binding protein [uncultured Lachnoclostridium sp.]
MIEVRNLVKYYGTHMAVDHLNFTIKKGQIYGFLGPNGAGKSTTMNIMTGYLGATQGQVFINGHDILSEPYKAKKDIGYLPEQPPLYMDMTVLEYLKFVAALKLIDKSIKSAQLDQVISLDEPTVGLDPQQIIEIRQLIRGLAKDHTVILSSHILSEVREVCDHIMIIYQGKLVASDTPENLEQKMQGNETIELLVKGTPEQTRTAIRALPSLLSSQVEKSDEEGCTKALLTVKSHADIREDIFWAFSRNRLPLLRLANTRTTLEDIFLELTSDSAKGQAPAAGRRQGCEDKETTDEEDLTDESNL